MPQVYDGVKKPNKLGEQCIGCTATKSKRWAGTGPYACTSRACQRKLVAAVSASQSTASAALSTMESDVAAINVDAFDFADFLDAMPALATPMVQAESLVGEQVLAGVLAEADSTIAHLRCTVAEQQATIDELLKAREADKERLLTAWPLQKKAALKIARAQLMGKENTS